mmetsp:Transcript_36419/g.77679  ORF Transcript_36419/g.77679 Transcript_36419/m.77679 type:complete len:91 (+) Transcript_36419:223-495(+)
MGRALATISSSAANISANGALATPPKLLNSAASSPPPPLFANHSLRPPLSTVANTSPKRPYRFGQHAILQQNWNGLKSDIHVVMIFEACN